MEIQPVSCPTVPQDFHLQLRKRFYHKLVEVASQTEHFNESFCLFKGIGTVPKNYEDNDHLVEQEGTFWYLFGVQTPHCYALIDNKSGRSILFVPRLGEDYKLWMTIKDNANYQR